MFFWNEVIQFLFEEVTHVVCENHSSDGVTLFGNVGTVLSPCAVITGKMINSAQVLAQSFSGTYLLFSNLLAKMTSTVVVCHLQSSRLLGCSQHNMGKQDSEGVESTVSPCFLCRWP